MKKTIVSLALTGLLSTGAGSAMAGDDYSGNSCSKLPDYNHVRWALRNVVDEDANGLNNDMWATVVDRDGNVCVVTMSGSDRGDQWPGSRVISAQKANTANAFSLPPNAGGLVPGLALSTANLHAAVQPGGSLFGLQHSNPVDTKAAYMGNSKNNGRKNDPMVGNKIGGVNVFGGGVGLYDKKGRLLGAVGVSGDTSCRDHIVAWKLRDALKLDYVPAGVSATGDDNMIQDYSFDAGGAFSSASGFGHPFCGFGEEAVIPTLPDTHPIGMDEAEM